MANRKVDASGRSKKDGWHIRFYHWELDTPAFRSLSPNSKTLLIELKRRYNGTNNGQIALGLRDAAEVIHATRNTASKAFGELQERGFIRLAQIGSFSQKVRHATTWALNEYPLNGQLPSKEFASFSEADIRNFKNTKNKTRYHQLKPTVSPSITVAAKNGGADTTRNSNGIT